MSDTEERTGEVTLDANGTPGGGKHDWNTKNNNGICTEKKQGNKLKLEAKKPGEFKVEVKYSKGSEFDTEDTKVIVPYELTAHFKTEFEMQDDKDVIKKDGKPLDYIILQGDKNKSQHYNKDLNAITYIQLWIEEYDKHHKGHDEDYFVLKSEPDNIQFFKDNKGTRLDKNMIKYSDLTRGDNKAVKGIKVYLCGKDVKGEKFKLEKVKIWLELEKADKKGETNYKDITKGRIYLENDKTLSRDIEHVDKLLIISVYDEYKKLKVLSGKILSKSAVAISQACIPKCGHKTISRTSNKVVSKAKTVTINAQTNVPSENMEDAEELIWETIGNIDFPRNDFDVVKEKYFGLLSESIGQEIHPIIEKLIIARILHIQNDGDYERKHRCPGYHAEVIAVNYVLNEYFPNETDPDYLNKISVATGLLMQSSTKGLTYFEACDNCKSILAGSNNKTRIITDGYKKEGSKAIKFKEYINE